MKNKKSNYVPIKIIDISDKESFIKNINNIINDYTNGYFEIKNLELKELRKLIENKLLIVDLKLPILMEKKKLRQNFRDFDHDQHYHGMEASIFYDALLSLNDPLFISQNIKNHNEITFITSVHLFNRVTKEKEKVTIAFYFNFEFKSRGGKKTINVIKTAFGLSGINENIYANNDRLNYRVKIYEKGRGWLVPVTPSSSSYNYNICQKDKNVNEETVTFNDIEDELLIK